MWKTLLLPVTLPLLVLALPYLVYRVRKDCRLWANTGLGHD